MKKSYHVNFGVSSCVTGRAQLLDTTPAPTCLRASVVRVAAQKCTLARFKGAIDHASALAPASTRASTGRTIGILRQKEVFLSACSFLSLSQPSRATPPLASDETLPPESPTQGGRRHGRRGVGDGGGPSGGASGRGGTPGPHTNPVQLLDDSLQLSALSLIHI